MILRGIIGIKSQKTRASIWHKRGITENLGLIPKSMEFQMIELKEKSLQ
jgi:hypothetical protein